MPAIWPQAQHAIFPPSGAQKSMIEAVAQRCLNSVLRLRLHCRCCLCYAELVCLSFLESEESLILLRIVVSFQKEKMAPSRRVCSQCVAGVGGCSRSFSCAV